MPGGPPSSLSLNTATAGPDRLSWVGPGMWGLIYRSVDRPFFYRVLDGVVAAEQISRARAWMHQPSRPGLAVLVEADHSWDPELNYYFVRYEVPGATQTLADALTAPDLRVRLAHVAGALGALTGWCRNTGGTVLAGPAEIVFTADGCPVLLPAPFRVVPSVEAVFAQPRRACYLAPEIIRGSEPRMLDADDAYLFGALLAQCFCDLPDLDAGEMLTRAASGALYDMASPSTRIPAWMAMLPATAEARAQAASLLARQCAFDPVALQYQVLDWVRRLEPVVAINELRQARQGTRALDVVKAVLAETGDRDAAAIATIGSLAILGSAIAEEDLHRPLDAVEFLERAVAARPARPEAYRAQMGIIARMEQAYAADPAPEGWPETFRDLDSLLWRDFGYLSPQDQQFHETTVARYLINRERYADAAKFIYPRLFDAQKQPFAQKFDLNLDYVESLAGLAAVDASDIHLLWVENTLRAGVDSGQVRQSEAPRVRKRIRELRTALEQARKWQTSWRGPVV